MLRDFLRPQMLFDRHRVVGAALHRRVVADDHAVHPTDAADAGNHSGAGRIAHTIFVQVHAVRRQWCDFQKRRAWVKQHLHPFARRQLATGHVLGPRRFATTGR